jgi:basic amino acid/polyamine antiporter, APA family
MPRSPSPPPATRRRCSGPGRVGWRRFAVAGAVLWLPALNNLVGTRSVGAVAVATTVLKITALAIVAVAGLLAFHAGQVGPVRAHGGSWTALPSASALLLFSFLGMESAAVATNRVRHPERNVPRAITAGVAGVAVLYLASTLAVQGTLPQARLAESGAPFADAAQAIFGGGWAAKAIAAVALMSALGSLNGFNLVNSEMAAGAARDGLFPRPLRRRVRGPPVPTLLLNTILATALIAFDTAGDLLALFTTLALLSTFVYVFGYVLSVAAELCHSLARRTRDGPPTGTLAIAAIALAMVLSLWMAGATGAQAVQRGTVLILIGIPVYVVTRRTNPSRRSGAPR